jgi:hypothetical protein
MPKLDVIKTVVEIGNTIHSAVISHRDERARREKEQREAEDKQKDRRIKELERQLKEA